MKVQSNFNVSNTFGTMKILLETGVVRAIEGLSVSQVRRHTRDILSIFFNMRVYCVFSLELPQRGDSTEYTQYTISQYKKENHPKLSQICNYGIFSKGLNNELKTAVVNEHQCSSH